MYVNKKQEKLLESICSQIGCYNAKRKSDLICLVCFSKLPPPRIPASPEAIALKKLVDAAILSEPPNIEYYSQRPTIKRKKHAS